MTFAHYTPYPEKSKENARNNAKMQQNIILRIIPRKNPKNQRPFGFYYPNFGGRPKSSIPATS